MKPVVACLSNVAASGGYCVAEAAHAIVAQPQTITGSIGGVSARFSLGPLLDSTCGAPRGRPGGVARHPLRGGAGARVLRGGR
ncbi:S49 family peptidase [Sorangium sp. So ce448]|uniref:S49 family peptidase n=1 Tax=Sorangium sp. So ce448 TaxID=3133314 RepID=UPI003F62F962